MHDFEQLWAMQPTAFVAFLQEQAARDALPEARSAVLSLEPDGAPPYELVDGVAVIPMEGVISRQGGWYGTGLRTMQAALDHALADPAARAVLFSVYSPGGSASGVKEFSDAIFAARRVKPCAAWVDGLCASAAYWLASATGAVYAGPSAIVGSIGVILRHLDKSGLNAQLGLAYTYVTAGSYKAVGNPDAALSDRDKSMLQARVDAFYELFCCDVAQRMGLAPDNRTAWADGRDFLANEAEQLGLVTALMSSRADAIQKLLASALSGSLPLRADDSTAKETHMDKSELAKNHPDLLASIQSEAAEAARKEAESAGQQRAEQATATALALMETVCGPEAAAKVRALVQTGVTPEQLKAAAQILAPAAKGETPPPPDQVKKPHAEMLAAIKAATPAAVGADAGQSGQDETMSLIQRIGSM
ncbi:MAG: S49 family peptidase [Desulfovibrio fairfieldensis]